MPSFLESFFGNLGKDNDQDRNIYYCTPHKTEAIAVCLKENCKTRFLCQICKDLHPSSHFPNMLQFTEILGDNLVNRIDRQIDMCQQNKKFRGDFTVVVDKVRAIFKEINTSLNRYMEAMYKKLKEKAYSLNKNLPMNDEEWTEIKNRVIERRDHVKRKSKSKNSSIRDLDDYIRLYVQVDQRLKNSKEGEEPKSPIFFNDQSSLQFDEYKQYLQRCKDILKEFSGNIMDKFNDIGPKSMKSINNLNEEEEVVFNLTPEKSVQIQRDHNRDATSFNFGNFGSPTSRSEHRRQTTLEKMMEHGGERTFVMPTQTVKHNQADQNSLSLQQQHAKKIAEQYEPGNDSNRRFAPSDNTFSTATNSGSTAQNSLSNNITSKPFVYDDDEAYELENPSVGPILMKDGATFVGQMRSGKRNGRGKQTWGDGRSFEGYFRDDKMHGRGRMIHPNGDAYEGEWVNGYAQGKGIYEKSNGWVYDGEWSKDQMHGRGIERYSNGGFYEGEFRNGTKHGAGKLVFEDHSFYIGNFRNGHFEGQGRYQWSDGRVYEGEWAKGLKHGRGCTTYPDGKIYQGEYRMDKRDGFGVFEWGDGRVYKGYWRDNKQNGKGKLKGKDGKILEGVWKNGKVTEAHKIIDSDEQNDTGELNFSEESKIKLTYTSLSAVPNSDGKDPNLHKKLSVIEEETQKSRQTVNDSQESNSIVMIIPDDKKGRFSKKVAFLEHGHSKELHNNQQSIESPVDVLSTGKRSGNSIENNLRANSSDYHLSTAKKHAQNMNIEIPKLQFDQMHPPHHHHTYIPASLNNLENLPTHPEQTPMGKDEDYNLDDDYGMIAHNPNN